MTNSNALTRSIAIGGDHAGFQYKSILSDWLKENGYDVKDLGTYSEDSVDYPDFAHPVAEAVEKNNVQFGVLICGTANGVAITANKHQQIRAGISWNTEVAKLLRQHNDANIICIPARFVSSQLAIEMLREFLVTPFEGGRHGNRVNKMQCM